MKATVSLDDFPLSPTETSNFIVKVLDTVIPELKDIKLQAEVEKIVEYDDFTVFPQELVPLNLG